MQWIRGKGEAMCWYLPLAVILRVGPGPVLLIGHWPVAARVAGATDVLHLPLLLHGLTDAGDVTRKLWIRADCAWKGRTNTTMSFLTPSAFLFGSPELNPFSQTVDCSRKTTMAVSQLCTMGRDCNQKSLLHCKNRNRHRLNTVKCRGGKQVLILLSNRNYIKSDQSQMFSGVCLNV